MERSAQSKEEARREFFEFLKGLDNPFIEDLILKRIRRVESIDKQNALIDDFLETKRQSPVDRFKALADNIDKAIEDQKKPISILSRRSSKELPKEPSKRYPDKPKEESFYSFQPGSNRPF